MEKLRRWWHARYGLAQYEFMPPLGHILRVEHGERWLRIHSLPGEKRYAETSDEYSILLTRHNTVATAVLGDGARGLIFVGRPQGHPQWDTSRQQLPGLRETTWSLFQSTTDEDEPAQMAMNFWCAPVRWKAGQFDELIHAVADDEEDYIVFVSLESGEVYAPYDGGADLILSSSTRCAELNRKFAAWIPQPLSNGEKEGKAAAHLRQKSAISQGVNAMNNDSPEGAEEDFRGQVPTGVAFTKPHPDIDDDSLPLDGSLTFKDTEPEDQTGLHPDETRILTGSEATSTASGAVDVSVVPPPESLANNQTANTTNR